MLKYNLLHQVGQPINYGLFGVKNGKRYLGYNNPITGRCYNSHFKKSRFLFVPLNFLFIGICLPLTMSINTASALNVTTANEINGNAPYLTFDNGITKVNDTNSLLGITLSDGTIIKADEDNSSESHPIELPNANDTYSDIQTAVPFPSEGNNNYPVININNLLNEPYNYFGDDDGDGNATAMGNVKVKWESKNAHNSYEDITSIVKNGSNAILSICNPLYKLTISSTDGHLQTEYGVPNTTNFAGGSHTYYIKPNKKTASVCYAQPSLVVDGASGRVAYMDFDYYDLDWDGITWVANKGYRVFSASNSGNYEGDSSITWNNFPSTGSHGLFFYLLFKNITPAQVLAANGNTVRAEEDSNVSLALSAENTPRWAFHFSKGGLKPSSAGDVEPGLKITLKGPRYNTGNKSFSPVTFKLYADSEKTKLLYEFRLMRWYIVQPGVNYKGTDIGADAQAQVRNYCQSLGSGYRLPDVNDYTNSNTKYYGWEGGIPGRPLNSWDNGVYRRQLSYKETGTKWQGGIFSEWGCMTPASSSVDLNEPYNCTGYPGSDWDIYAGYWSGNSGYYNLGLTVSANEGGAYRYNFYRQSAVSRAVCVAP
jgi:hypothetical protein